MLICSYVNDNTVGQALMNLFPINFMYILFTLLPTNQVKQSWCSHAGIHHHHHHNHNHQQEQEKEQEQQQLLLLLLLLPLLLLLTSCFYKYMSVLCCKPLTALQQCCCSCFAAMICNHICFAACWSWLKFAQVPARSHCSMDKTHCLHLSTPGILQLSWFW